jgi:hypothetical protein
MAFGYIIFGLRGLSPKEYAKFSHFSLSKKSTAAKVLLFMWCLAAGVMFVGCDDGNKNNDGNPLLDGLPVGNWISSFDEEYSITTSKGTTPTFTSGMDGFTFWSGEIVNFWQDGEGAGYITIQYAPGTLVYDPDTLAVDFDASNKFYVIHWKNRRTSSVELAGASDGKGKATKAEAETEYTVDNGYFAIHSACQKQ